MYFIVNHRCHPKVTQLETLFYFLLSVKEECVAVGAEQEANFASAFNGC